MAVFFLDKCLRAYSRASIDIGRNVSDKGLIHGLCSFLVVCSFMRVEQTRAQAGGWVGSDADAGEGVYVRFLDS